MDMLHESIPMSNSMIRVSDPSIRHRVITYTFDKGKSSHVSWLFGDFFIDTGRGVTGEEKGDTTCAASARPQAGSKQRDDGVAGGRRPAARP